MKSINTYLISIILLLAISCNGKTRKDNELFVKQFNWSIMIPDFLIEGNKTAWKEVQKRGEESMENTLDVALKNKVNTIFILKSGQDDFFESTNEKYKGNEIEYNETIENTYSVFYETLITQLKNSTIDTIKTTENIDGIVFKRIDFKLKFANGLEKTSVIYSALINANILTVSVMYANEEKGQLMIESLRSSKFN